MADTPEVRQQALPEECSACGLPHWDAVIEVDGDPVGKVYSPDPRPMADGHEAVLVGYNSNDHSATISAEFNTVRATAQIPWPVFLQLVDDVRAVAEHV